MKLLLDTHIWIWMMQEPKRLSRRVQEEIQDTANDLWLSPISTWEVLLLHAKQKIQLHLDPAAWISTAIAGCKEAPLTHEIVVVAHRLPLPHLDPADRFLAATAKVLGLTLVTADQKLLGLGDIRTLANR